MINIYEQTGSPADILQRDAIAYLRDSAGEEPWVTVYQYQEGPWGTTVFFSALIPNSLAEQTIVNDDWDLLIGHGMPGCSAQYLPDGSKKVSYSRFGDRGGIEPLVFCREFHGAKEDYVEVSEEFRLLHNLYHDVEHRKFIQVDDAGNEHDTIIFDKEAVRIRLRPLKQFLAIKDMRLALYFSIDRYSDQSLTQLGLTETTNHERHDTLAYRLVLLNKPMAVSQVQPAMSRLEGKKLISGMPKETCGIWPYVNDEEELYEDFIVGTDQDGAPVRYTCDPDQLANYFGANPDAPHYLTPVFFKRDVLAKYYNKPTLYTVEDAYIRCVGLWGLHVDNNRDRYVVVYLGDLGRDLPASERGYWKSFNVAPDGNISDVARKRDFLAEFTAPTEPSLLFRDAFERLQRDWAKSLGWYLFVPPVGPMGTTFKTLRMPLNDDPHEYIQQVRLLADVLIESINVDELDRRVLPTKRVTKDGIEKLRRFLKQKNLTTYEPHTDFLETLRQLTVPIVKKENQGPNNVPGAALSKTPPPTFAHLIEGATALIEYLSNSVQHLGDSASKQDTSAPIEPSSSGKSGSERRRQSSNVDIAIITILPEEHFALAEQLSGLELDPGSQSRPNRYAWATANIFSPRHDEPYRAVLAYTGVAGTNAGAIATIETIGKWNPRYVLLVGVAGGLPLNNLCKGDVVVSTQIWGYEYGKIEDGFKPRDDQTFSVDSSLVTSATFASSKPDWARRIKGTCPTDGVVPKVVFGPVASGDKVVDNAGDPFFRSVLERRPKLQAIEMEGAGAAAAIRARQDGGKTVGFLMIRGISDMPSNSSSPGSSAGVGSAQTLQRDTWKKYAAATASAFAVHFICEAWPIPPRRQR